MRPRCPNCGYDLRDLEAEDLCPECGLPARLATAPKDFRSTDPRYTRSLALGATMVGGGMFGVAASAFLGGAGVQLPDPLRFFLWLLFPAGVVAHYIGWLWLLAPEPRRDWRDRRWGTRRFGRVLSAVCLAAGGVGAIALAAQGALALVPLFSTPTRSVTFAALAAAALLYAHFMCANIAACRLARRLAPHRDSLVAVFIGLSSMMMCLAQAGLPLIAVLYGTLYLFLAANFAEAARSAGG